MTPLFPRILLAAAVAALPILAAAPASAQASSCQDMQKILGQRKSLVGQINALQKKGKGKLDPVAACATFGRMVANGSTGLKWIADNKDWCQVPDAFADGFRKEHERVTKIRGQACGAAAKMQEMRKKMAAQAKAQARAQAQGRGNPLGGGGLTGQYRIPQGALPDSGRIGAGI